MFPIRQTHPSLLQMYSISASFSHSANSTPYSYLYSASSPIGHCPSFIIQALEFRERPGIVLDGVVSLPLMVLGSLAEQIVLLRYWVNNNEASKAVWFFIIVQATTSSLAASFTRIFFLMPGSFSLPVRYRVNNSRIVSLRHEAVCAA